MEKLAVVETHALELPGVVVDVTPVRKYLNGAMTAQIIGFTGEVTREELDRETADPSRRVTSPASSASRNFCDAHLRGKSGAEQVEVNVAGRRSVHWAGNRPVPGDNVILTIDSELQEAA